MSTTHVTPRGLALLKAELEELTTKRRPAITQAIAEAREHGDLKENSEYHAAREEQSLVEARIKYLESTISSAQVIHVETLNASTVVFGSLVKLYNHETDKEVTYRIVGVDESDVGAGRLSYTTPIAKGIIGKEIGDDCNIQTPAGLVTYEVLDIVYEPEAF